MTAPAPDPGGRADGSSGAPGPGDGPVTVDLYWRPGCGFCAALERGLADHHLTIRRHNIWDEPGAAAVVRSHAGGNETVPTVVVGPTAMVNPRPGDVLAAVQAEVARVSGGGSRSEPADS